MSREQRTYQNARLNICTCARNIGPATNVSVRLILHFSLSARNNSSLVKMNFCPNCGHRCVNASATFCIECGNALSMNTLQSGAAAAAAPAAAPQIVFSPHYAPTNCVICSPQGAPRKKLRTATGDCEQANLTGHQQPKLMSCFPDINGVATAKESRKSFIEQFIY